MQFLLNNRFVLLVVGVGIAALLWKVFFSTGRNARSVQATLLKMRETPTQVLDVREDNEFLSGHLAGAIHIPLGQLQARLSEIALWRDKPILVYCHSGLRSGLALRVLQKAGFSEAFNLKGGVVAWRAAGQPIEKGR